MPSRRLSAVVALGLLGALLSVVPSTASAADEPPPTDPGAVAQQRLVDDATGGLRTRIEGDDLAFAGVTAGNAIENPNVTENTSVSAAARADLNRYGAAFGVPSRTDLVQQAVSTDGVTDLVRYDQHVDGLPVVGAQVVVSLQDDRDLASIVATTSDASSARPGRVSESAARGTALAAVKGATTAAPGVRWLLDPAVLHATTFSTTTVWRFEVTGGPAVRHDVYVSDKSGKVVLDVDEVQDADADRIVCDAQNVPVATESSCTPASPTVVRTEKGPPSTNDDANLAFEYAGATSDFYAALGVDLTDLIGSGPAGAKKLGSTVDFCYAAYACPFANAFWNGEQMYYGQGYASADDVVAHEMTHGVIQHNANLLYYGQSGAINESLADTMGELTDLTDQLGTDGSTCGSDHASRCDWLLGEDLPPAIGIVRDMENPPAYGQPDSMRSLRWYLGAGDNQGVHSNSGVGNKTVYLITDGGTFNGQTVTGIGTDKASRLYLEVIRRLPSGGDYKDYAAVLDQSCQDLVAAGTAGFTANNCVQVHNAGLATELTQDPVGAAKPADAPMTCASGTLRVLFDSETVPTPTAAFDAGTTWARGGGPNGPYASSGADSWYSADPATVAQASSLRLRSSVALPAGQPSYLWFQSAERLEFDGTDWWDGGTVEVSSDGAAASDAANLPWFNGPTRVLNDHYDNPAGGRNAFAGDSLGFVAHRLDLSSYAGHAVQPQFTMNVDNGGYAGDGWYVDDVRVYTCDLPASSTVSLPTITGQARPGEVLTAHAGSYAPAATSSTFQWLRDGAAITGATGPAYTVGNQDVGTRIAVRETALVPNRLPGTATSEATAPVVGPLVTGQPTISGVVARGSRLSAVVEVPTGALVRFQWYVDGRAVPGGNTATYVPVRRDVGRTITVQATLTRGTEAPVSVLSAPTGPVLDLLRTKAPKLSGKAVAGQRLTARPGDWEPGQVKLGFQWLRDGVPIAGATRRTYRLTADDAGHQVAVQVTGGKRGFLTASRVSRATAAVRP